MTTKKRSLRPSSKTAWLASNDAGPHLAELPSGTVVRFTIPDSTQLAISGHLPQELRETALLIVAHPEGAEGYMGDLVSAALIRGEGKPNEAIQRAIERGLELTHELIAAMVLEPELTVDEVAGGAIGELDRRMLLEFAERRRSVDAAGNQLPIVTLDKWATFRHEPVGDRGAGAGSENGAAVSGGISPADRGAL